MPFLHEGEKFVPWQNRPRGRERLRDNGLYFIGREREGPF